MGPGSWLVLRERERGGSEDLRGGKANAKRRGGKGGRCRGSGARLLVLGRCAPA